MLSIAVVIASISIYNQTRRGRAGEYGRLFGAEASASNDTAGHKSEVVEEAPVADQTAPDPMLVAPAAREQLLMNSPATTTTTIAPVVQPQVVAKGHGTTIVGEGNAVKVVKAPATSTAPQPVLSGGIFKQQ